MINPIRTDEEYLAAMDELDRLWNLQLVSGTEEAKRFNELADRVDAYEREHFPMPPVEETMTEEDQRRPEEIELQSKIDALALKLAEIDKSLESEFKEVKTAIEALFVKADEEAMLSNYTKFRHPTINIEKIDARYNSVGWRTSSWEC